MVAAAAVKTTAPQNDRIVRYKYVLFLTAWLVDLTIVYLNGAGDYYYILYLVLIK